MKPLLMLVLVSFAANMNAKTVCEGKGDLGYRFRLEVESWHGGTLPATLAVIAPSGEVIRTDEYTGDNTWDGHSAGLLTAPGLSLTYRNSYGRIHGVTLTTVTDTRMGQGWIDTAKLECREC